MHDAFIALQQHQSRLRDPAAAIGYLRTTVVNKSRSVLRKRQTVRRHLSSVRDSYAEPADSELLLAAGQQEVLAAVRQLPRRQQEVLALRYWGDLSEAEIAETLGISRGAVKSNASEAWTNSKRCWERADEPPDRGPPARGLPGQDRAADRAAAGPADRRPRERAGRPARRRGFRAHRRTAGDRPRGHPGAPKRQHRWIAPTLAAAAVAAVAVGVTALVASHPNSQPRPNPPATHFSSPPPSSSAPAPSPSATQTHTQTVTAPPYLPAGQTGSRSQVPWSLVGSGWRLLQREHLTSGMPAYDTQPVPVRPGRRPLPDHRRDTCQRLPGRLVAGRRPRHVPVG